MRERWEPTQEQKDKFIPILNEFIEKMKENPDEKAAIDFYNKGISPYQLKSILEDDLEFDALKYPCDSCDRADCEEREKYEKAESRK